jgi:glycosyltransferase involved in cell wall biosynthesis
VKDGAATLKVCLAALEAELPAASEILVVDDGSTDGSGELAAARGHRVLWHGVNRGTSAARNTGWRAAHHELVGFVDADMVVLPGALRLLCAHLGADGSVRAVNGTLSEAPTNEPLIADYVNESLRFQLAQHGERVASAFTAICVFRRSALEEMGGWDERWSSRYADDVNTRYQLPPGSIVQVPGAQGRHLKRVAWAGLLRHRINIGVHFVAALSSNREHASVRNVVLDWRYPANTIICLGTLMFPIVAGFAGLGERMGVLLTLWLGCGVALNLPFAWALGRRRVVLGLLAAPLRLIEGGAMALGLTLGALRPRGDRRAA